MLVLRALMILAVLLLMPLGMQPAEASNPMSHHPAAMSAMAGDCHGQDTPDRSAPGFARCTMACAAALPAVAPLSGDALEMPRPPLIASAISHLIGLEPETATPPPRNA